MFDKIFLSHKPVKEIQCQTHPEKMDGILQLRGLYSTKKAFPFPTFSTCQNCIAYLGKKNWEMGLFFEQYHAKFRLISLSALGQYARGIRNYLITTLLQRWQNILWRQMDSVWGNFYFPILWKSWGCSLGLCVNGPAHPFPKTNRAEVRAAILK